MPRTPKPGDLRLSIILQKQDGVLRFNSNGISEYYTGTFKGARIHPTTYISQWTVQVDATTVMSFQTNFLHLDLDLDLPLLNRVESDNKDMMYIYI